MPGGSAQGFICTRGKAWKLYTETLLPNVEEGLKLAAESARRIRPDDRDEGVVRHRPGSRDAGHAALGGAGAHARGEDVGRGPDADGEAGRALPVERAASRWIVSTDPDEQIEKIQPYVEMGFRHLVFHAPGPDQERFLRLYGEQVLPKLRRRFD